MFRAGLDLPDFLTLTINACQPIKRITNNFQEVHMASERKREIKRRRHRRDKIKKLRAKLAEAKNKAEKDKIIAEIRKTSPKAPVE